MNLTINLATRRYINQRRLNIWLIASFLLLAALLVYQVRTIANNQVEIDKIRRESAAASSGSSSGVTVTAEQMKALEAKIAFGNSLIAKKTINWIGVLDKLEGVVPPGVTLSQVEPVLKDQALQFSGMARNFDSLRVLLENMEQSPNFTDTFLVSQSEVKVGKTQRGLAFNISTKVSYR